MMITECLLIVAATIGLPQGQFFPGTGEVSQLMARIRESVATFPVRTSPGESSETDAAGPIQADSESSAAVFDIESVLSGVFAAVDDMPLASAAPATEFPLTLETEAHDAVRPSTEALPTSGCDLNSEDPESAPVTESVASQESLPVLGEAAASIEISPVVPMVCDAEFAELQTQWSGLSDQTRSAIMMLIHADEMTRARPLLAN